MAETHSEVVLKDSNINNACEIDITGDPGVWKFGEVNCSLVIPGDGDIEEDKKEPKNLKDEKQPWWTPECEAARIHSIESRKKKYSPDAKKKAKIDQQCIISAAKAAFLSKLEQECGESSTTEGQGHGDSGQTSETNAEKVWTPSKAYIDFTEQELRKLKNKIMHQRTKITSICVLNRWLAWRTIKCKYISEPVKSNDGSGETVRSTLHFNYLLMAKATYDKASGCGRMKEKLKQQLFRKAIYILCTESIENIMSGKIPEERKDLDKMSFMMPEEVKEKLQLLKTTVMCHERKEDNKEDNLKKAGLFTESKCGLDFTDNFGLLKSEAGTVLGWYKELSIESRVFVSVKAKSKRKVHKELFELFVKTMEEKTADELYEMLMNKTPVESDKLEDDDSDTEIVTNKGKERPKRTRSEKNLTHEDFDPGFFGQNMEEQLSSATKRKIATQEDKEMSQSSKKLKNFLCSSNSESPKIDECFSNFKIPKMDVCSSNSEITKIDEFDAFGQTVAHSLRRMSVYNFNAARKRIVDVIYDIEMNDSLNRSSGTCPTEPNNQSQQNNNPRRRKKNPQ